MKNGFKKAMEHDIYARLRRFNLEKRASPNFSHVSMNFDLEAA